MNFSAANAKYLSSLSAENKAYLLGRIAGHYEAPVEEIEAELTGEGAEALYEYIGNDPSLRMYVYRRFQQMMSA